MQHQQAQKYFRKFGEISQVKLTGKGCGHIEFVAPASAQAAFNGGDVVDGRSVHKIGKVQVSCELRTAQEMNIMQVRTKDDTCLIHVEERTSGYKDMGNS